MTQLHGRPSLKGLGIKLHPIQKICTYVGLLAVAASGVWWSYLHDLMASTAYDLMHSLLVIHGAFAFVSMLLIGALIPQHIRMAWNAKRNRISGGTMTAITLIIVVTGFGLYYAGEDYRDLVKWVHLVLGLISVAALLLHILLGRRSAKPHVYQKPHA